MPEINSVAGQLVGIPVGQVYTAGKGIKIDNVNKVVSVDETVIYSTDTGETTLQLSEPLENFERIRFKLYTDQGLTFLETQISTGSNLVLNWAAGYANAWTGCMLLSYNSSTRVLTVNHTKSLATPFNTASTTFTANLDVSSEMKCIREIVGINRIASN